MAEEFSFAPVRNGTKPKKKKKIEEDLGFSLDEDLDNIEENINEDDDEEEDEIDEFERDSENPPLPAGGASGIFANLTGGGGLVETDASVKELFSNENLLMKTDISGPAIPIIARLFTLAYKYKAEGMKSFLWSYLKLRVSKDRNGRNDIVALALRRQGMRDDEDF